MDSLPLDADQERLWQEGIRLFNGGQYFEAHEVWEDLWRPMADTEDRRALQGLIQLAVALTHRQRGNVKGYARLSQAAQEKYHPGQILWTIPLTPFFRELES